MDSCPITARSLAPFNKINGDSFERAYKEHLSDFPTWDQKEHANKWTLHPENMGTHLSIDETMLHKDLRTILSNKNGHGKRGTLVATVKGTKPSDVIEILKMIPEDKRNAVTEVTMDFSDSMRAIVVAAFPNATIVVDCFHIIKRVSDSVDELRLKEKRAEVKAQKKEKAETEKHAKELAAARKRYRKNHPKKYPGKKRGRKPQRANKGFSPKRLSNGDTAVELLTRSRNILSSTPDKLGEEQLERRNLVLDRYPKIKEATNLLQSLRCIFRDKLIDREGARLKLHEWYNKVSECTLREVKSARDLIKMREEDVLNYFINHSTNAAAESLNSKLKGFRSQIRGVSDVPFFMYRCSTIFG
jgi:transposase